MEKTTVGEIQKIFAEILRKIRSGEEVVVTKRGQSVAQINALEVPKDIDWPDFFHGCMG